MSTVLVQMQEGSQMWVSKEVSDDLMVSEINPEDICFRELEWPSRRLEVYFQDPAIPTFLAHQFNNLEQKAAVERLLKQSVTLEADAHIGDASLIHIQAEDGEGSMLSLTYKPEAVDAFAGGEDLAAAPHLHGLSGAMSLDEAAELRRLTVLFYKLLLFAGSEGHEIRRTMAKPTRTEGGKPGFKNRPAMERLILEYLPYHRERKKAEAVEAKKSHAFNGRRGHFRVYRSERYKAVLGTRQFIFPVPGPDGTVPRKKFVVRKPQP